MNVFSFRINKQFFALGIHKELEKPNFSFSQPALRAGCEKILSENCKFLYQNFFSSSYGEWIYMQNNFIHLLLIS